MEAKELPDPSQPLDIRLTDPHVLRLEKLSDENKEILVSGGEVTTEETEVELRDMRGGESNQHVNLNKQKRSEGNEGTQRGQYRTYGGQSSTSRGHVSGSYRFGCSVAIIEHQFIAVSACAYSPQGGAVPKTCVSALLNFII